MRNARDESDIGRPRRRLDVARIKLVVVSLGGAFSALLSAFTGITPQASFAPMLGWMLGFSREKSQATAMRATAGTAIACVIGAIWRASVTAVIAPVAAGTERAAAPSSVVPHGMPLKVLELFVGATVGAVLFAKAVPRPGQANLRRALLFVGVCIGVYVGAEGAHFTGASYRQQVTNLSFIYLLLGIASGALSQVSGLASGIILVPGLYFVAGLSAHQSILVSLTVIGLAALLPAWSYSRRGAGDSQYGSAGMVGGIACGFVAGAILTLMSERLLLLLFALLAMFLSAREISRLALDPPSPAPTAGNGNV